MPGAEEPPDQGPRHVAGADEADLLHEPSPPTEEPGRLAPGPRPPNSARPSRSSVAPSSTATGKSSLIPIERWGSSTPRRVWARSRSSRSTRKWGRDASGPSGGEGIAIRPSRRSSGWPRIASATACRTAAMRAAISSRKEPCLLERPAHLDEREPDHVGERAVDALDQAGPEALDGVGAGLVVAFAARHVALDGARVETAEAD